MFLVRSFDLGNGHVKFMSSSGGGFFPSVFAVQEPGIDFEGLKAADDLVLTYNNVTYAGGWSVSRLSNIPRRTLDRSRIMTEDYKMLFLFALVASSKDRGGQIAPVLSLPVAWYDRRSDVKRFLAGNYDLQVGGRCLHFEIPETQIRIVPEGFGTVCASALDSQGRGRNGRLLEKRIGVVDIGTKTTDLSYFEDMVINPAKTKGYDLGLSQIYNIMERLGERELGHRFTWEELDESLHGAPLFYGPRDVTGLACDWRDSALEQVSGAIAGYIRSLWQGGNDVQEIVLAGGGAEHVYPYLLREFPDHLRIVTSWDDSIHPAMTNVTGAYYYGVMKARGQNGNG